MTSRAFQEEWRRLYDFCPWATVYQDVPFVTVWYACYADSFEPLVICESDSTGRLLGAMFLAVSRTSGALALCGTSQAEYDVWLAVPDRGSAFLEAACTVLRDRFPRGRLEFLFLPPKAPTEFSGRWNKRCFLRPFPRPLLTTARGSDAIEASLRKKGNKSKLNQLQRLGELKFERITNPEDWDVFLDGMIPLFDVRQVALCGTAPFREDPSKRYFLQEMLRRGILHVTAMWVGGRLVAGHVGQINGREVVLGMIPQSPFVAKYSVGKLQLLLLAAAMQRDGFDAFDLTPGGEYKDRFASHYDQAHILTVFFSHLDARRYRLRRMVIDFGKRCLSAEKVKEALTVVRHKLRFLRGAEIPGKLLARLRLLVSDRREHRVYILEAAEAKKRPATSFMNRDVLEDLLLYEPSEASQPTRQDFVRRALIRLGTGHHFYSRVEDGRLVHWGWLVGEQASSHVAEVDQTITWPPGSAVLFDFYTRSEYRGRGFYGRALRQMTVDAAQIPGVKHVVITVSATNLASRRGIERNGFHHWQSLCLHRVLRGRRRRSAEVIMSRPPLARREPAGAGAC